MKNLKTAIIFLLLVISTATSYHIHAQDSVDLTEAQKELLRQRVVQKVEEFTASLSRMVDPELSNNLRTENQTKLLSLFMEKGQPYETEEDGITKHNTGVKMMTSSVNRTSTTSSLLRVYVKRLYDPATGRSKMRYSKISIQTANAIRVDNIYKEGDRYVCMAYFYQDFVGYIDNRIAYKDRTCKKIKCYITPMNIPGGTAFDVKLGDITVVSTERI